jgi:hypothetical protein
MPSQVENISSFPGVPGKYELYRTSCACGDHTHTITVGVDMEDGLSTVEFYYDLNWDAWYQVDYDWDGPWYGKLWSRARRAWLRAKCAARVLFVGRVEFFGGFTFRGSEQIGELVSILERAEGYVRRGEEERMKHWTRQVEEGDER